MNTNGGILIIGIDDSHQTTGIENDLSTLGQKQNRDGFELQIRQFMNEHLGVEAVNCFQIHFEQRDGKTIARVDVRRADEPVWVVRDDEGKSSIHATGI